MMKGKVASASVDEINWKQKRAHQVESQVVQKSSPEGYSDESNSTRILKSIALARGKRVASITGMMVVNFMVDEWIKGS